MSRHSGALRAVCMYVHRPDVRTVGELSVGRQHTVSVSVSVFVSVSVLVSALTAGGVLSAEPAAMLRLIGRRDVADRDGCQ